MMAVACSAKSSYDDEEEETANNRPCEQHFLGLLVKRVHLPYHNSSKRSQNKKTMIRAQSFLSTGPIEDLWSTGSKSTTWRQK
jgi:hypothetical protein